MNILTEGYLNTESGCFLWNDPGIWNAIGEIATRKFHLVFVHWSIALVFVLGLIVLGGRFGKDALGFWEAFPLWLKVLWIGYVIVVSLTVFNTPILTHSMLRWGLLNHVKAMLWGVAMATIPVMIMGGCARRQNILRNGKAIYVLHFLATYTMMTSIYMLNPFTAIE